MSALHSSVDSEAVRRLVLARLLVRIPNVALTRKKIVGAVVQAIAPPLAKAEAERAASAALDDCEQRGWVAARAPKKARGAKAKGSSAKSSGSGIAAALADSEPRDGVAAHAPMKARGAKAKGSARSNGAATAVVTELGLTALGERAVPGLFGLTDLFTLKSWEQGQQLAALSGIGRAHSVLASRADAGLSGDELAAVLIAAVHSLDDPTSSIGPKRARGGSGKRKSAASASWTVAVVDRLAWRALGVDRSEAFTSESVQRYLLRDLVPESARVPFEVWRRMIAGEAVGANRHDAATLTRALLCRSGHPTPPTAAGVPPDKPRTWSVRNDNGDRQATRAGYDPK